MLFFQLVRREMQGSLNRLLIMFGVGGISIASILAAINAGAHAADSGKPNLWAATLFIVALLLFIKTQNFNLLTTTAEIECRSPQAQELFWTGSKKVLDKGRLISSGAG